jgi:hypothetical protein
MASVRWTVQQASEAWGVPVPRIYKWIYGRSGSKGGGRRDEPGSRRRLSEGIDFVYESVPRGKIIVILNDAYPMPLLGKINRPTGIRRQPKVVETPEAVTRRQAQLSREEAAQIVREAQAAAAQQEQAAQTFEERAEEVPAPAPQPPPTRQVGPIQRRGGQVISKPPPRAPEPPTFAQRAEPESIADDFDPEVVKQRAAEAWQRARGYFAARNNTSVGKLDDALIGRAVVNGSASVADATAAIFDNVLVKAEPEWRDSPALSEIRAAFREFMDGAIEQYEIAQQEGRLAGVRAFRGRLF